MKIRRVGVLFLMLMLSIFWVLPVSAQAPIRIGGLMTLEGPFTVLGQEAVRGMEMALEEVNYTVAGRRIQLIKESSDGRPDVAVTKARKLIEQDRVDILIGPVSGGEGLAIKEYAKTVPGRTFINGFSAAQETTLISPAPNFFRFNPDGAQWQAGLGSYVYDVKGYRNVAVVAGDYSFGYTQVLGFMTEFCARGGRVREKIWVPMGTRDFSSAIARIPDKVDAVYVMFGGADSVNFLTQYFQAGMKLPIIGGSNVTEQTVLNTRGPFQKHLIGIPSAHMVADGIEDPAYQEYVARYRKRFPDALTSPSATFYGYYVATTAALTALAQVGGDLGGNQVRFRDALSKLRLNTPTGPVSLDENRQAIGNIFVTEVAQRPDGSLYTRVLRVMRNVNQTLGQPREAFIARGVPSRDNPSCP
jgi:branched-chain amino acid transport system substrate-binding protein